MKRDLELIRDIMLYNKLFLRATNLNNLHISKTSMENIKTVINEKRKQLYKIFDNNINQIISIINKFTIQLFYLDKTQYKASSSGVLLNFQGKKILLTVHHSFISENKSLQLYYKIDDNYYPISPTLIDDSNDLGVIQFDNNSVEMLETAYFEFYYLQNTNQNSNYHTKIPKYLFYGYPANKTKNTATYKKNGKLAFTAAIDTLEPINNTIALNYDRIVFQLDKGQIIEKERRTPTGISGSGLWYIPNLDTNPINIPNIFLVGIMKEFNPKKDLVFATDVNAIFNLLKNLK